MEAFWQNSIEGSSLSNSQTSIIDLETLNDSLHLYVIKLSIQNVIKWLVSVKVWTDLVSSLWCYFRLSIYFVVRCTQIEYLKWDQVYSYVLRVFRKSTCLWSLLFPKPNTIIHDKMAIQTNQPTTYKKLVFFPIKQYHMSFKKFNRKYM